MKLKEYYQKHVIAELQKEYKYKNAFQVPRIVKVVLNVGLSKGLKDSSFNDHVESSLTRITGQKPLQTLAKKSISNFKIREGMVIGMKVTLRGARMWDFLEKLIKITLPRVRDFRGISTDIVDHEGNVNIGIKEHISFPEIKVDEIDRLHGLEVAVVTTAKSKVEGVALLKTMGFPFNEEKRKKK